MARSFVLLLVIWGPDCLLLAALLLSQLGASPPGCFPCVGVVHIKSGLLLRLQDVSLLGFQAQGLVVCAHIGRRLRASEKAMLELITRLPKRRRERGIIHTCVCVCVCLCACVCVCVARVSHPAPSALFQIGSLRASQIGYARAVNASAEALAQEGHHTYCMCVFLCARECRLRNTFCPRGSPSQSSCPCWASVLVACAPCIDIMAFGWSKSTVGPAIC